MDHGVFRHYLFELMKSSKSSIDILEQHERNLLLEIKDEQGASLLHVTAGYGKLRSTTYLISIGADVNAQNKDGQTPLHYACGHVHFNVAKLLIERGAKVDMIEECHGWTPLAFAINRTPITEKCWELIEMLIERGASPVLASKSGRIYLDKLKNDHQRIQVLVNYLEKIHDLTEREKLIDKFISTDMFFDLIRDSDSNLGIIEKIATPKLLNSRSEYNGSPMHTAAGHNQMNIARFLIVMGCDVDIQDSGGRTPLHNASQFGNLEIIEMLIDEGYDVNKQDDYGLTPLHYSAEKNMIETCLKLMNLGADPCIKSIEGKLPYDMTDDDAVKEYLKPQLESSYGYYDVINADYQQQVIQTLPDELMLDVRSDEPLCKPGRSRENVVIDRDDPVFKMIEFRMISTIKTHTPDLCGPFSSYNIVRIRKLLNNNTWKKYKLEHGKLEVDYGMGNANERLLFHGSTQVHNIRKRGFDERWASEGGMFGPGIYFAEDSSKSNQYTLTRGKGCDAHKDKTCYECDRVLIYAQVALGKSLIPIRAMPKSFHAPHKHSSITAQPNVTEGLKHPEYVIYNGSQAYPLYEITYKIVK